jgi:hypothetical protein
MDRVGIEAWVDAGALMLGLPVTPGNRPQVVGNLERLAVIAARLDAGTVWVNCWMLRDLRVPFGGVKDSGIGREGGHEALKFFSDVSNVCIAIGEAP